MPESSLSERFLPYGKQSINDDDIAAVVDVLRGDWLTTGPAVDAFETAFAQAAGAPYAIACANGTAALHLALLALGVGPGDRVVVPSITFVATANTVRHVGAEVIFADVDPDTGLMTPSTLKEALSRAPGPVRAVMPVHLAGQPADMDGIAEIAADVGAELVEDACHALGSTDDRGGLVGACSTSSAAAFSLHPVKTIAAGEGGVVTTRDLRVASQLRQLRNHGMVRERFSNESAAHAADGQANPWYYEMPAPGFNYRLTDIQAALATSQLNRLGDFVRRRQELVSLYDKALSSLAPVLRPTTRVPGRPGWHLYAVLIDFEAIGLDRAQLMAGLRARKIGSQVHYIPVHKQPYYADRYDTPELPGAKDWYRRTLSLPLFPSMADQDINRVAEALRQVIGGAGIG